jgi:hypothetical protein
MVQENFEKLQSATDLYETDSFIEEQKDNVAEG